MTHYLSNNNTPDYKKKIIREWLFGIVESVLTKDIEDACFISGDTTNKVTLEITFKAKRELSHEV